MLIQFKNYKLCYLIFYSLIFNFLPDKILSPNLLKHAVSLLKDGSLLSRNLLRLKIFI